ncbi:MAG TPA: glycerophosphodiester phosphodiesterase family protein [Sporichthyaceae bacterium]
MRRSSLIGTNLLVAALAIAPAVWDATRAHGGEVVTATPFRAASTGPAKPATFDLPYLQLIGHRGGNDWAPENTVSGLTHSFQIGARAVEFDVHFSSDQTPMVMHDETLNRTTNCTGAVESHTYAQLRQCVTKHGEPVPNIYEALAVVARAHGAAYVHVKQADNDAQAGSIVAAMNRYGLNDGRTATVIADKTAFLDRLSKAGAKRCGLIFSNPVYWSAKYPVLIPFNTPITRTLVARAQRAGHFVIAVQGRPVGVAQVPGLRLDGYMANKLTFALAQLAAQRLPAGPARPVVPRATDPKRGTAGA